jgi:transposase
MNHLLRKVNDILDFSFIYDEVEGLYCSSNGRPSIEPVVLVKLLLIGFLYGINSERRISEEVQVNMAYRWFLGLDIMDKVPDHSTISQNRRRRFNGSSLFRNLFQKTVTICIEKGLADGKLVVVLSDTAGVSAR